MLRREEDYRVTVFGAGIAGLTAAHELATRGYQVEVIDPEINEEIHSETTDRGIGGMARSQFAFKLDSPGDMQALRPGRDLLLDQTIVFDEGATAVPLYPDRAKEIVGRLVKLAKERADRGLELSGITVVVPAPDANGPSCAARLAYLYQLVPEAKACSVDSNPRAPMELNNETIPGRWLFFTTLDPMFAAEHGFRFFPSFYRHLFDTMKRTPILGPKPSERGRSTVFENLVPTDGLGFARAGASKAFLVPRREIASFETMRKHLRDVLGEMGYTLEDLARFQLTLFKYMTSSTLRRTRQYEHISWGIFVEQSKYSEVSRQHIEFGPQMSAALRGSKSDARTQGNVTVQLLADQLKTNAHVDSTLNGPSSGAWLDHWHRFLDHQQVVFRRGKLDDFEVDGRTIRPLLADRRQHVSGDHFVLALSLPAMAELAPRFIAAVDRAGLPISEAEDFVKARAFAGSGVANDLAKACPDGPLQHLSGIQYYFDTEVRFWRGHTQYLDSAWGLTSISQPQFWARARNTDDHYRSILSVDIGIFDRDYQGHGTAWSCTSDEIARYTWEQIVDHHDDAFTAKYGDDTRFPQPFAYALDRSLDTSGARKVNSAPFLVNKTSAYPTRPGAIHDGHTAPKHRSAYRVHASRFVVAGTFMQTFTRLTSMEAANESARHAVNALLQQWHAPCDHCEIWDPEDEELPDLHWLKELDEQLMRRGLPHFVDVLGWTELPERLLPADLAVKTSFVMGGAR